MTRRPLSIAIGLAGAVVAAWLIGTGGLSAAGPLPTPEQFTGFTVGADNKLVRWDKILEYMKLVAGASDRVHLRELGKTSGGSSMIALEISSPETIKNLDRYKQLERRLYFQGGAPAPRERDDIFRRGKIVVLITCSVHANEVGPTQMTLELVHHLATDNSTQTRKILDNVVLLLVPSLNPDGQILVTDWFNQNLGTRFENSPMPYLYHPYAGHDINRDMYMLTQKESQYVADLAWHDWFPAVWLDEHQMESNGPRIFVMPASDPINPNVHPLIYRWNAILGQSQAAALEAAGKAGIIYNSTYTNFWEGAMAWSGWWHNQIGLLTEIASARTAGPVDQRLAPGNPAPGQAGPDTASLSDPAALPPPFDTTPRTEYLRPWLGGRWTLGDVVDYGLISTLSLLDTAADRRETLLRQVYEVNRQTVESGPGGNLRAILIPAADQHDRREVMHLIERLQLGGVEVDTAQAPFEIGGRQFDMGTFVVPMTQVFARYAKDLLERQIYPDVRRAPNGAIEPPYDVTAWSLGMQLGVNVRFVRTPLPDSLKLSRLSDPPAFPGQVGGKGDSYTFDYTGADAAIAVNRLLANGATVSLSSMPRATVSGIDRAEMERIAKDTGISVAAQESVRPPAPSRTALLLHAPRIALYAPWTGGNIDEGWTRWVLEQYEFGVTTVHNDDVRVPGLRERFDVLVLPDQNAREMIDGANGPNVRPEYHGGIGEDGVRNIQRFVAEGGTLVALGASAAFAADRFGDGLVRDEKRGLRREQHFAPGAILHLEVDTSHPLGYGSAAETFGFYDNGPFFTVAPDAAGRGVSVIARYPRLDVLASGWLKGEELMAGRGAVVVIDKNPGRIVLFGIRPQHRAQTHATFPLFFNALYLAAADDGAARLTQ